MTPIHVIFYMSKSESVESKYADEVVLGDRLIFWTGKNQQILEVIQLDFVWENGFWASLTRFVDQ